MFIRCFQQIGEGKSIRMHHHWVPMSEISPHMPVAVMASEDQRFLLHHGFDYQAIEKAALHNLEGKKKHGASTISQQTAKNVFLWPGRSWVRKGFEAYFTVLIEFMWSKQRIMEVYLNSIEMGDGIYGVDAVAADHFATDAADLSRSQCALIAATLPNPRKFSSKDPSAYMLKRRLQIEHEMTKKHYISFIAAVSSDRMQMVKLYPEGEAQARFKINGVKKIYFYCNRSGLFSVIPSVYF